MTKAANVSVTLTAIEIEHILLALSCFDSEVDEHFHVTEKLNSTLTMSREKALPLMKSGGADKIEAYAQKVVEDMDIDDLMDAVKESIIDRMEDLPEPDALGEIEESVYADEILNK